MRSARVDTMRKNAAQRGWSNFTKSKVKFDTNSYRVTNSMTQKMHHLQSKHFNVISGVPL